MKKPEVGQIVFSLNINRAARLGKRQVLTPLEVKTVGRKYFTAGKPDHPPHMDTQYFISNGDEKESNAYSKIYESPQAWEDDKEYKEMKSYIQDIFQGYQRSNLSLEDLRDIKKIIQKS